jgi:hypothetical protein
MIKLRSSLWKFYARHHDLVNPYGIYVSQMTADMCHKWRQMCSVCRNHHNLVLSSFMTYHRDWNNNNTTSTTCGTGTAHPSGAPEFTPVLVKFYWGSIAFCIVLCRLLFVSLSLFHCIVRRSSIYGFWLPLWYLQTFP